MKIFKRIFSIWCLMWFVLPYFVICPIQFILLQRKKWYPAVHFLNKIWTRIFLPFLFIRIRFIYKFKPDKNTAYIYCPNHASYLDVPVVTVAIPGYAKFIGKIALNNVPLFGYMYSRLYIPVDRNSRFSRYRSMIDCFHAIDHGISVVIFPEGTINKNGNPKEGNKGNREIKGIGEIGERRPAEMIPFKDGPFRIAIEKQIPVVPVTLPFNRKIFPDDGNYFINPGIALIIIHKPIETKGMSVKDIGRLKEEVFKTIDEELKKQLTVDS